MTSNIDAVQTNEFLRRRKLRLQQVREQSKDIAKKIRQRAKEEKSRHAVESISKREKEYFECQEKFVKRLEQLYAKGLQNVGTGHKNAVEVTTQETVEKTDLSKTRGREAVAELRKKKQEKLNEQKKILDRKLQAREVANEISREKSNTIKNSIAKSSKKSDNEQEKTVNDIDKNNQLETVPVKDNADNPDTVKNDMGTQWENEDLPNEWESVPALSLPKDDSLKDGIDKSYKGKRPNLFALSDEMPSSLRGGLSNVVEQPPLKPSLTLITDYLQNRNLRLRQSEPSSSKKSTEDLQSIRQTILRTRAPKADVSGGKDKTKSNNQSIEPDITLTRKKSVSVYNHGTRDIQEIPCSEDGFVVRDSKNDADAYAQAYKETTLINNNERDELNKMQQNMRNRVAVTRQNVDKEYRDTLAFLNSLPKDTGDRPIRTAYMDDERQSSQKDRHQRKMQDEFRRIEKECCKHGKRRPTATECRSKSRSPNNMRKDFEYSWMPVPEGDGSLAIHSIPNKKTGNTVKFGQDSYHEYRSRHKHTPPTKDNERKKVIETVIVHNKSTNESSVTSETSSVEDMSGSGRESSNLKDAEKIIIYKILQSKKDKRCKHKRTKTKKQADGEDTTFGENSYREKKTQEVGTSSGNVQRGVSFEELREGVYKAVKNNGDNMSSLRYSDEQQDNGNLDQGLQKNKTNQPICPKHVNRIHSDQDLQTDEGNKQDRSNKRRHCKCDNSISNDSGLVQPSAATSTSSFKTATNDKGNTAPDTGFIQFLDEGGQERGKFYIGASGFIKDDDYEVVIQLRKKEGESLKKKDISKENNELDKESKTTLLEQEINQIVLQDKSHDVSNNIEDIESPKEDENVIEQINNQKDHMELEDNSPKNINPTTCEKAVLTSFHDSFAIPDEVPKSEPIVRAATSTYTQTSFSSPMQRPVFMHMSSSTSTAYMSPPDIILPKFLKQNYVIRYDTLDSEDTISPQSQPENRDQQHLKQYCCNNLCGCERCVRKGNTIDQNEINKMKTPPNTARSSHRCLSSGEKKYNECKKPKCRKCIGRNNGSKHSVRHKAHRNKSNHSFNNKKAYKNLPSGDNISSTTQTPQYKINNRPKSSARINPVVKKYVNELLSLNKQGHKAIEIINEDCSSVATPSSSIINVTTNEGRDSKLNTKISLEEIKNMLKERILKDISNQNTNQLKSMESQTEKSLRIPKKKSVHKVKSLNISKRLQNKNTHIPKEILHGRKSASSSSSTRDRKRGTAKNIGVNKCRSKSSPTPRHCTKFEYNNNTSSDVGDTMDSRISKVCRYSLRNKQCKAQSSVKLAQSTRFQPNNDFFIPHHRAATTSISSESGLNSFLLNNIARTQLPTNTCTQTNEIIDTEANFMQLAENKLQNMEKIADLTEKCTKRLSNLAKVLEEVRRNKSSVYSQISTTDSASESDNKSGKYKTGPIPMCSSDNNILIQNKINDPTGDSPTTTPKLDDEPATAIDVIEFTPFLKDIPRPEVFKSASNTSLSVASEKSEQVTQPRSAPSEQVTIKFRGRPPPALNRINIKHAQDALLTPHELSTVVEVDSPMSLQLKNQSSKDPHIEVLNISTGISDTAQENFHVAPEVRSMSETKKNPDLLQSNIDFSKKISKNSSNDSSDDSKIRMMDMKQFNDIMLKPFISLQEYAKQCNIGLDDGSNSEDFLRDDQENDELSSLHSDGSLPDVIAELLKRKIIAEPFKFDSASNINSTTLSSESTISMLALSKIRKEKKKSIMLRNKENIAETSETLSISSNPDLEKAFQKLGMGWASSTLKKTKERLALSSSSSTSSSSLSQFKIKSFSQNVPTLGTDSTSSLITSNSHDRRKSPSKHSAESSKNAVQQTSLTNSMTVKEFLTNELAKKITFYKKSTRKEADEEFVSLYETKMPEEIKNAKSAVEDEPSITSVNNNRARTSTPVQIFKSTTYRSSSSSNTSNGLFSNVDDLSSVKGTSNSIRNHSTSDKDDLTIPNCSLKTKKELSDRSKSD